jgi:hypothetical protein
MAKRTFAQLIIFLVQRVEAADLAAGAQIAVQSVRRLPK